MKNSIYNSLMERKQQQKKSFAVLVDPDKVNEKRMEKLIRLAIDAKVDYFFVGGRNKTKRAEPHQRQILFDNSA